MVAEIKKTNNETEKMRKEMLYTIAKLDKTRLMLVQSAADVLLIQQKMTDETTKCVTTNRH